MSNLEEESNLEASKTRIIGCLQKMLLPSQSKITYSPVVQSMILAGNSIGIFSAGREYHKYVWEKP